MVAYNILALAGFLIVNIAMALTAITLDPNSMVPITTDIVIAIATPPALDAPIGSVEVSDIATVIATTIFTRSTLASVSSPCSTEASGIATIIATTISLASTTASMSPPLSTEVLVTVEPTGTTNCTLSRSIDFSTSATGFRIRTTTTASTVEPTQEISTIAITRTPSKSSTTGSVSAIPSFANEADKIGGAPCLGLVVALGLLYLVN